MRFTVQTENMLLLRDALDSRCDGIRFGPEFCEQKIPDTRLLEAAYTQVIDSGKAFSYQIPILSNIGIKRFSEQLDFLNSCEDLEVIIGDFGVLNILDATSKITVRLGRPRVYIPGRSPWSQITRLPNPSFFERRKVSKIFYQTNLNYQRSLEFYKTLGISGADVDWIPECFPSYRSLIKKGFNLALHTYNIPIAVTLKCHTARFLEEKDEEHCTQPCLKKFFVLEQENLKKEFYLYGNTVYRKVKPEHRELKQLKKIGIDELVMPMGAFSGLNTSLAIDESITYLSHGV